MSRIRVSRMVEVGKDLRARSRLVRLKGKNIRLLSLVFAASILGVSIIFHAFFFEQVVQAILDGRSLTFLNNLVRHPRHPADEYYFIRASRLITRGSLILAAIPMLGIVWLSRSRIVSTLNEFLTVPTHPLNLAVTRIVVFGLLLKAISPAHVYFYSGIPAELAVLPQGSAWLFGFAFPDPEVTFRLSILAEILCITAVIGLFSRTSAVLVTLLGVYLLGIPQLFGKVNHYHHLLWFAALLAASRCGDYFSFDAIIKAIRQAGRGSLPDYRPAVEYGIPLRLIWLLIGVIYFFPGFWKLWSSGFYWVFSDNLRYQLYSKWLELGNWQPIFRVDHYPFLLHLGAFSTIAFEISFVFLIFRPGTRFYAVCGGLLFHNLTNLFMRISFLTLQYCYVAFIDWAPVARWFGRRLFPEPLVVLYDGSCGLCRRAIAAVVALDVFQRVSCVNARDRKALEKLSFEMGDQFVQVRDMHVFKGEWVGKEFDAYRAIVARLPSLWIVYPFLYLPGIERLGKRVYRRITESRTCAVDEMSGRISSTEKSKRVVPMPLMATGLTLLLLNLWFGMTRTVAGWPFACYPTFAEIATEIEETLDIRLVTEGKEDSVGFGAMKLPPERFRGLVRSVWHTKSEEEKIRKFEALRRLLERHGLPQKSDSYVRFYTSTISILPEKILANPIRQKLLIELPLGAS